ncbi:MAG: hypothetical protein ABI443_10290 [Chthoniobacterales bacterium]
MKIRYLALLVLFPFFLRASDYNAVVLEQIKSMPQGGGYSASSSATANLRAAMTPDAGRLEVNPAHAMPSYCSGATYLVFLKTLGELAKRGEISLSPEVIAALRVQHQRDGDGAWGRWNANGPGTARLFAELGVGKNFASFAEARPGDFMKVFWNDNIGSREHGHSVVFLGTENRAGVEYVKYWSSNIPGGYGEKAVPLSRIHRVIFSRLEQPRNVSRVLTIPKSDAYLASMLTHDSSWQEVKQKTNIP